ncbi:hypothetical protein [Streptomyces cacaoi]|uniref:hypothetical protein n=1 Tax=Streptomyces cacaoi TaxID=1898 RepID=UPI0011F40216|nr:hypothetical protein [Streptomyces cacaoi]
MSHVPDINREPDYTRLLNLQNLSTWTLDRQREHGGDRTTYEAALASFQSHLRSQHIDGDRRTSALLRSRKVEKHLRALIRASQKAEQAAEGLRTAYAAHVAHVTALPGQREAKAAKKAAKKTGRRTAAGELTAKSLGKSAAAFPPPYDSPDLPDAAPAAGQPRGITELWKEQSA